MKVHAPNLLAAPEREQINILGEEAFEAVFKDEVLKATRVPFATEPGAD